MKTPRCPTCGQSVREYGHKLTIGLVGALRKFKQGVLLHGRNDIHLSADLDGPMKLTHNEHANFQKLRLHGLVAKVYHENGKRNNGHWLLTRRGNLFLKNELQVPDKVYTKLNKVVRHSDHLITIKEVGLEPIFEDINTIEKHDLIPPTTKQERLFT